MWQVVAAAGTKNANFWPSSTLSVSPSSFLTTAQPSLSPSQHLCLSLSLSLSLCLSVSVCILFNLAGWDEWQKMPPHVRWLYLLCVIKLKPFSYCTFQKKFKKKKQCSPPHMLWKGERERKNERFIEGKGGGLQRRRRQQLERPNEPWMLLLVVDVAIKLAFL